MRTRIAGLLLAACLLPSAVAAYDTLERGEGGTTALDIMEMFVGQQGDINEDFIDQLFGARVMASMNIPAAHVRVAFYDAVTGRRMDRHEIRELVGDEPHDGMVELLFMAEDFVPGGLPMEVGQLVALMDASYVSSMRRPPPLDVEFYDARCGPKGRLGGGVSGYTPREPCVPGQEAAPSRERAPAVTEEAAVDAGPWQAIDLSLATRYPISQLPQGEAAMQRRLASHDFPPPVENGAEAIPVHFSGRSDEELFSQIQEWVAEHTELGYEVIDITNPVKEFYGDEVLVAFVHIHVRKP